MNRFFGSSFVIMLVLALAATAEAQPLPDLSLEDLMRLDAGRVFGASERIQPVTEAPASVSFITAEEIARYSYRTLADILRTVRGLYVTNDRNFSYLGTRGFGKPGDYNSRILLLVNGHRVNDNVFGQAEIGAEFGLDPAMFERVEIIRGPASSLYGDSAFFAVVNVITRTGASLGGTSLALEGGTLGTQLARASVGRRLNNGLDFALSGTYEQRDGVDRLYFPEFDSPATNNGIAEGLDGEQVGQIYGRFGFKGLTVTGAYGSRKRDVPTASFDTVFNPQEFAEQTTDRHTLLDADYGFTLGSSRVSVRASYDRFTYDGTYPFAPDDEGNKSVARDDVVGARWTLGSRLTRPLPRRQTLTVGAEFINNVDQNQDFRFIGSPTSDFTFDRSSVQHALYVQDEIRPVRWLIVNVGLRYDGYEEFLRVTPRTALIVMPSAHQSFKYLYGGAFRAPNTYELNTYYFGEGVYNLRPETIDTHELVWERYTSDWLRTSVSGYWYRANRLITLNDEPAAFLGVTYVNQGRVRAKGLEFEAQMRLWGGIESLASYALQRATDQDTHSALTNSPMNMAKIRMSAPWPTAHSSIAVEVIHIGRRETLLRNTLDANTLANFTIVHPIGRSLELVGSIRNLFDEQYADPGAEAHQQDSIPQNGRTARIGVRWKFPLR